MNRQVSITAILGCIISIALSACDANTPENVGPRFVNINPDTTAVSGSAYRYTQLFAEGDGDNVQARLVDGPGWLRLESYAGDSVALVGTPRREDIGRHPVALEIADTSDEATIWFHINVAFDGAGEYAVTSFERPKFFSGCYYSNDGPFELALDLYGTASGNTSVYYSWRTHPATYVVRDDTLVVTATVTVNSGTGPTRVNVLTDYWLIEQGRLTLAKAEGFPLNGWCAFRESLVLSFIDEAQANPSDIVD